MGYLADQVDAQNNSATTSAVPGPYPDSAHNLAFNAGHYGPYILLVAGFVVVLLLRKLWANQSEGAKRLKLVIKLGVLLLAGAGFLSAGGPGIITAAVIGVAYWIYKGFKKP